MFINSDKEKRATGKPAATVGDFHACPQTSGPVPHVGGPVIEGSPDVLIGGRPAVRAGDKAVCVGPPDTVSEGSPTVFINGKPAASLGSATAHGGRVVIGNPTVTIGDGTGNATVSPSEDLSHIPPAPGSFDDAKQRLNKAADQIASAKATGAPPPASPYTTADKMALVENGLQESLIVRVVKSSYANNDGQLGPPGKPATYWTTTFTQIEHGDHDSAEICRTLGMPHDPDADYTMLLIDQEAAAEEAEMVSFIPTSEAMVTCLEEEAVDNEELAPVKDDIGPAMTPTYSFYYEHLHQQAAEKGTDLDNPAKMADLAEELGFEQEQKNLLGTRHLINRNFGANDQFLGNGLTNDAAAGNPHTPFGPVQAEMGYGVAEVFTYDKNPKTQGELIQRGLLDRVPLN